MHYYLGLDNGGTTTKASIYTSDGMELCTASTDTKMIVPQPGFTERDMEEMWQANCQVIRDVIRMSGLDAAQIAALAVCGHGKGLYLWGKNDKPTRMGIISTDKRSQMYVSRWKANRTEEKVFALSNQHIMASQPVALLAWLKDHEPDCLKNIQYIFAAKDYIRFRLTGEAYAEYTDYSGDNFVNLSTKAYDKSLLGLFGLEELLPALPPLRKSTDICGYVTEEAAEKTGLKAGTPVAGGMFDIDACALAVGVTDESSICMIAGTWSINEYIRKTPVLDKTVLMNSLFCMPEYYLIEESSPTSAGNNQWFIHTLLPELQQQAKTQGESIYELMNTMVASLPADSPCPIFHPFLMASNMHPNAMASFIGLSNYHTRAHLARSIYEGIAFAHRYHFEKLAATCPQLPEQIHLAGGAARSQVWAQIFADVMDMPVRTSNSKETGTLGCAITAAVACGEYADIPTAVAHMVTLGAAILPKKENTDAYHKKYKYYLRFAQALSPLWDDYHNDILAQT